MINLIFSKSDIKQKTVFTDFDSQLIQDSLINEIWKAYSKSEIANGLFNTYLSSKTINISKDLLNFGYLKQSNEILFNFSYLEERSYINDKGTVVKFSVLGALVHEFCHMWTGDPDNNSATDYQGDIVRLANKIWAELRASGETGLDKEISITGIGYPYSQVVGRNYTSGAEIDAAYDIGYQKQYKKPDQNKTDWYSDSLVNPITNQPSRDLLLGDSNDNTLSSGAGNDYLYGRAGNDKLLGGSGNDYLSGGNDSDYLDGGSGIDIAGYIGSRDQYKVDPTGTGTWSITNIKQTPEAGTDTLTNIEFVQFADPQKPGKTKLFKLTKNGLVSQKSIAFVIDNTTNTETFVFEPALTDIVQFVESFNEVTNTVVSSQVEYTKSVVSSLINAAFADENNDVEIGIVAFNDTKIGNPSQVILPFTNQDNFADRKAAALAAINSVIASDGGDIPETPFDGLKLALSGSIGEWRIGTDTRQIFLFTDAPAKDYELATEVNALAQNIGATITDSSTITMTGGVVNTFNLAFNSQTSNFLGLTGSADLNVDPGNILPIASTELIDSNPTTTQIQIFTIFTGALGTDTTALEAISTANGGAFLAGLSSEDLVKRLSDIVNPAPIAQPQTISIIASDPDAAETKSGEIANPGQFILNRTGDLTQSLAVSYTLSGRATNVTDYQTIASTVTFAAGNNTATINVQPLDDNIYEGNEDITITLNDGGTNYKLSPTTTTATVTITDNETKPIVSIANVAQSEGNSGMNSYAFNLTLSNASTETVTVKYATADGTATAVSDYTAATGTVTFNPGETNKAINISVKGDTTLEKDETFAVNLTDPVGGTISQTIATGTIVDDDRPVIALTTPDANASENKKDPGLFNLTRTGSTAQALTVSYTIAGTATNDTDYKKLTGTATFKAGQAQTSIEIKPTDDKIYEGSETVILALNDGGTNYKFDPIANTGTVTIADEDLPSISISVTDNKAAETKIGEVANPGQFTLKRTGINTDALTVSYTIDGSASNGIDYQKLENSVTFAAGSDTAIINIKPIDDQLAEGTETVKLKLSDNSNYKIDEEKSGTIKITDNNRPREIDTKDLVLKVENLAESNSRIGTGLQGGSEGEVIDLRSFAGQTLKVDTITVSDAGYQNYIGFYAVEDAQGTLANGLKVSDPGYAEAAIKSVMLRSSQQQTQSDLSVVGGKIFAPVVIANGTFEDYLNRNPQNQASSNIHAYFNYIGANTDQVDHFKLLGDNKFGIEDVYGGGDRDYNDLILQMNVRS
jgi:Calx-beta domain/Domain of unknown function (DUF4114)/RTX calcium-binding nonapeptide repeat (4 copies)